MLTALVEQAIVADEFESITFAVEDVPELAGRRDDYLAGVFVYEAFISRAIREAVDSDEPLLESTLGMSAMSLAEINAILSLRYKLDHMELYTKNRKFLLRGLNYLRDAGLVKPALGDAGIVYYSKQDDERKRSKVKRAQIDAYKMFVKSGLSLSAYKAQRFEALLAA